MIGGMKMDNNTNIQVEDKINPIPLGAYTIGKMLKVEEGTTENVYQEIWGAVNYTIEHKRPLKELVEECFKGNTQVDFVERFSRLFNSSEQDLISTVNDMIKKIPNNSQKDDGDLKEMKSQLDRINKLLNGKAKPTKNKSRFTLYKLSFAFELSWDEHIDLFTKICKVKLFLRTPAELCLTYCKKNNKTYADAVSMYEKYLKRSSGETQVPENKPNNEGTRTVFNNLCKQMSEDAFIIEMIKIRNSLISTGDTIYKKINNTYDFFIKSLSEHELNSMKECLTKVDKMTPRTLKDFLNVFCLFDSENNTPFYINLNDMLKPVKGHISGNYKNIHDLRKIYIICLLWENFISNIYCEPESDNQKTDFTEFIKDTNINLNNMNLPQLDPLDDFDMTMILCAAYLTISNWANDGDFTLDGLIKEIYKEIYLGKTETM